MLQFRCNIVILFKQMLTCKVISIIHINRAIHINYYNVTFFRQTGHVDMDRRIRISCEASSVPLCSDVQALARDDVLRIGLRYGSLAFSSGRQRAVQCAALAQVGPRTSAILTRICRLQQRPGTRPRLLPPGSTKLTSKLTCKHSQHYPSYRPYLRVIVKYFVHMVINFNFQRYLQ